MDKQSNRIEALEERARKLGLDVLDKRIQRIEKKNGRVLFPYFRAKRLLKKLRVLKK